MRVAITALVLSAALAGCVADAPAAPAPAAPSGSSASGVASQLLPVVGGTLTAEVAASESIRIADALVSFIDPAVLVNDDVHSLVEQSTVSAGQNFALIHTMTLDRSVDPAALAKLMVGDLREAGWIVRDTTNREGVYLVPMVSDSDPTKSWFLGVGADSTVAGQPVVSLQVVSPDYAPAP